MGTPTTSLPSPTSSPPLSIVTTTVTVYPTQCPLSSTSDLPSSTGDLPSSTGDLPSSTSVPPATSPSGVPNNGTDTLPQDNTCCLSTPAQPTPTPTTPPQDSPLNLPPRESTFHERDQEPFTERFYFNSSTRFRLRNCPNACFGAAGDVHLGEPRKREWSVLYPCLSVAVYLTLHANSFRNVVCHRGDRKSYCPSRCAWRKPG